MKYKKWIALFSQTGSEIYTISHKLNRYPDTIYTNKKLKQIEEINNNLLECCFNNILFIPSSPTSAEYNFIFEEAAEDTLITLHGYLKILPPDICSKYSIFNGHPGDIETYPELKGYNPQEKAFELKLKTSGSIIHKITAIVDDGPVVSQKRCNIDLSSLENTIKILHHNSIELWVEFLQNNLIIE